MNDAFDPYTQPCPDCRSYEKEYDSNTGKIFCLDCGLQLGDMVHDASQASFQVSEPTTGPMPKPTRDEIRAWNKANPHERPWKPREKQIRFIGQIHVLLKNHSVLRSCKELYKTLHLFNAKRHDNSLKRKYGSLMKIAVDSEILYEEENQGLKTLQQKQQEGYQRPFTKKDRSVQNMATRLRARSVDGTSPCGEFVSEGNDHLMVNYICAFNRSLNRVFRGGVDRRSSSREEAINRAREQFHKCWDVALRTVGLQQEEEMYSARDDMFDLLVNDGNYPLISSSLGQLGCQLHCIYRYMKHVLKVKVTEQMLIDAMEHTYGRKARTPSPQQKALAKKIQEAMRDDG